MGETLDILMCADSSTDNKTIPKNVNEKRHVTCHVSCVTCHMSPVMRIYGNMGPMNQKQTPPPTPSRGPQSLSWWDLNPGQPKISQTNLDENHVLKSENHAKNDQEECLIKTRTDGQKKILKQTQTICDCDKKDCLGKTHRLSETDK